MPPCPRLSPRQINRLLAQPAPSSAPTLVSTRAHRTARPLPSRASWPPCFVPCASRARGLFSAARSPIPSPDTSRPCDRRRRLLRAWKVGSVNNSLTAGGIAHETYSNALGHAGPNAEQHLRAAVAQFASAMEYQPDSTWAALKRAGALLHLSSHCHYDEEKSLLVEARQLLAAPGGSRCGQGSPRGRM